jgi:hypothetical protein
MLNSTCFSRKMFFSQSLLLHVSLCEEDIRSEKFEGVFLPLHCSQIGSATGRSQVTQMGWVKPQRLETINRKLGTDVPHLGSRCPIVSVA